MSALQLRPKHRTLHNPSSFIHLFSTTPDHDHDHDQSSSDVKATLKSKPFTPLNQSFSRPSKADSLEEIRKNLSEFRTRSSVPPPSTNPISFQELYNKRNAMAKADNDNATTAKFSFDAIRQSLNVMKMTTGPSQNDRRSGDPMSLSAFKSSLKLKPAPDLVIGGTDSQHFSVFAKERERKEGETETMAMKTEFVKMYGYEELGMKLRKLRPSVEEGNKEGEEALCFSLSELNDRLMKLREMEEKETELSIAGLPYKDLRETLVMMTMSENEKAKRNSIQRLDILGQLGRTPNFMLQPPKEHLVEKYFHPDNMSSAEKLKIELAKVRDEFKMSDSDCGSARVQVAQLTTKIKHLSSVLHKKDKHSIKGLLAMVQRRKRILKYLRRTDWDSYCLVLSKLGLRDNPNYKH